MDVRCEKCQTEYELDEARLKPGGVTVKCTNCGHMFKIRKRANTDVGVPAAAVAAAQAAQAAPPAPAPKTTPRRQDSIFDEAVTVRADDEGPTTVDRQWLIRLENGEQKSCRELATLQQWIVSGVVSRESLISRTGKTWKRIGDIAELAQYFQIADEAKNVRAQRALAPTAPVAKSQPMKTMIGVSAAPTAAGGTILPDDEQSTTHYTGRNRGPTPPPPVPTKGGLRTPPQGSPQVPAPSPIPQPPRRAQTTPPPPPPKRLGQPTPPPVTTVPAAPPLQPAGPAGAAPARPPDDGRATAMWATDTVKAGSSSLPFVGKLSAIPDEPAFAAGRVRGALPDESSFDTGRVRLEDEDDLLPRRRGSRVGLILALLVLLVGGATAAVVYAFVLRGGGKTKEAAKPPADAQQVAVADAAAVVPPPADAAEAPKQTPVELAKAELASDNEARLRTALESLAGKDEAGAQAMRSLLRTALAQALLDRAGVAERADADKLRKEQKQLVLEAATDAQKAYKAAPEDPAANLALAAVLRLQGKSANDQKRYLDAVKAPEWARDAALASALALARDGKLDDAKAAFAAIDQGDGKLETSGDVRARFHLALIALAQSHAPDAKPLVDQVLAAQPEHAGAKALAAKLETVVAKTDPLPPEENHGSGGTTKPPSGGTGGNVDTSGGYDQLLARANKLADSNCSAASTLFSKALEQKPNGVEALTGLGYCYIEAKQFSNAYSKFRSALAVSSRYQPALRGIAEMYQQQGLKDQAIEAYQHLLEYYPNDAGAKKQLERLGVGGSPPANGGSAAPPPPQPPPAQPTPPAEGGAGSGAG